MISKGLLYHFDNKRYLAYLIEYWYNENDFYRYVPKFLKFRFNITD